MTADKTINAIEIDIDPELEKRIADRYDLPKMLSDDDEGLQHAPSVKLSQSNNEGLSKLEEIPEHHKPLEEIYKIKLHPLPEDEIPDDLKRRYLISNNVYYSKNKEKGLVFEDKGKVIQSKSSEPNDIEAMISLAQIKNWSHIKVSGAPEFKQEVWLRASLEDIKVEGYTPTQQDIALLNDAKNRKLNKLEVVEPVSPVLENNPKPTTSAEVALVAAAKAKGAGQAVQSAMKGKIKIAVDQLTNMGVTIPKPIILDPNAPPVRAVAEYGNYEVQKNIKEPKKAIKR